jgi:hypothetical protein
MVEALRNTSSIDSTDPRNRQVTGLREREMLHFERGAPQVMCAWFDAK